MPGQGHTVGRDLPAEWPLHLPWSFPLHTLPRLSRPSEPLKGKMICLLVVPWSQAQGQLDTGKGRQRCGLHQSGMRDLEMLDHVPAHPWAPEPWPSSTPTGQAGQGCRQPSCRAGQPPTPQPLPLGPAAPRRDVLP